MGIKLLSTSSYDNIHSLPNPDPKLFRVVKHFAKKGHLALLVNYPGCTNYEGDKVLVYRNTRLAELLAQGTIDPHFSQNPHYLSPCARFEPTKQGWRLALNLLNTL